MEPEIVALTHFRPRGPAWPSVFESAYNRLRPRQRLERRRFYANVPFPSRELFPLGAMPEDRALLAAKRPSPIRSTPTRRYEFPPRRHAPRRRADPCSLRPVDPFLRYPLG
jgi:hypothetical protein